MKLVLVFFYCVATVLAETANETDRLACNLHIHGLPYTEVARLPRSEVGKIKEILSDQDKQSCWENAIIMVGILGDIRTDGPYLTNRFLSGNGVLGGFEWHTKTATLLALGFLANRGSDEALNFLMEVVRRKNKKQPFGWQPPHYIRKDLGVFFARQAIMCLGVSGKPPAKRFILRHKNDWRLEDSVRSALELNERITRLGIENIYR